MKTAEEYSNDVMKSWSEFDWDEINFNQFKNYVKNYIEQAQKEAYNQAKREMFLNMQYYMEYCLSNKYVTPQEWIEKHKHF